MKKVYFDSRKCLGCRACEFACAVEHSVSKDPRQAIREPVRPIPRRDVQLVEGMCLTVACRHCDPAPCVEACIAGAMTKDPERGQVNCNTDKCVGCWMCVMVCPFDAVRPGKTYMIKCDMCPDRKDDRACLVACPTQALFEADAAELKRLMQQRKPRARKVGLRS